MATVFQDPYLMQQMLQTRVPASRRTSTAVQTENGTETTNQQNMTPAALAALEQYIAQLMAGGTPEMQQQRAQRDTEVNRTRAQQDSYSKAAAFNDARGLISQTIRQAMERNMPTLVRAAEGAGTSANSMRALMAQQVATQAAEAASAQGLQAAAQYGSVASNFGGILERLTQFDPNIMQALGNALQTARGAVQNTTRTSSGTRTTDTTMSELDALAKMGAIGGGSSRSGPTSISTGGASSFGPGPGHSFPNMLATGNAGGNAGYSHIFSQQSPGQSSLPAGYNAGGSNMPTFTTPAAETNFWSDRATARAVAEMLPNSTWSGYGEIE